MVSIKKKEIRGRAYMYAEYSFRLPDKKVKKISKFIKSPSDAGLPVVKEYFIDNELKANVEYAMNKYKTDNIFTEDVLKEIELARIEYKKILNKLTKEQLKDLLDRFTANFTYESNAIEGSSLTLKDVTLIMHENFAPKGKDLREIYETRNTREVNDLLFSNKIHITIEDIKRVHALLMKDTGVHTGWKRVPNFLLMRNLRTSSPEEVDRDMEDLVKWYEKDKSHPLRKAVIFHHKFEHIHPFEDGNGRTGRILVNAILCEHGYPPIIIRKTSRQEYFSGFEAADNKHIQKLERFFVEKFKDTFNKFFRIYVKYLP